MSLELIANGSQLILVRNCVPFYDESMSAGTDVREILQDHGYRLTSPRWLVWSVLRSARGHMTADEIGAVVREADPTINLSSIYRSLALFEDLELVRSSQLGIDGSARWEITHPDDEFHVVCRKCGKVDHHSGALVDDIRSHMGTHGFVAENVDLVLTGLCANCAADLS